MVLQSVPTHGLYIGLAFLSQSFEKDFSDFI